MTLPPVQIRDGSEGDLHAALSLLDDAVRWLVARGRTGQWGEKPFSEVEARVAQIRSMLADRTARIAVSDGRVVGFCVLAELVTWDCCGSNASPATIGRSCGRTRDSGSSSSAHSRSTRGSLNPGPAR